MKKIIHIITSFTLLISCSIRNEEEKIRPTIEVIEKKESDLGPESLVLEKLEDDILLDWINYYQSLDSSFSIKNFYLERTDTLDFNRGNVLGIFDKNFDQTYLDFIVYSQDKK